MMALAAKAGFGVVVILTAMGIAQSQTFADMFVALVAAGMLPGTNFQIPAELVLVTVAWTLMFMTAYLYRDYLDDRDRVRRAAQDFENYVEDPPYESLIPGLGRVAAIHRAAQAAAYDAMLALYFWTRSLGRPVTAQAVPSKKSMGSSFVRFDGWANVRAEAGVWASRAFAALRSGALSVRRLARLMSSYLRSALRQPALMERVSKALQAAARGATNGVIMFDILADKTGRWFMRLISFSSSKKSSGQNEDLL